MQREHRAGWRRYEKWHTVEMAAVLVQSPPLPLLPSSSFLSPSLLFLFLFLSSFFFFFFFF